MKYILIFLFVLIYINKQPLGYSDTSPLYTHFCYMFQHVNLLHLLLNLLSFFSFWLILQKVIPAWVLFLYIYISAVTASFFTTYPQPTVGASGMVYTLIGIYLALIGKKLKIIHRRKHLFWLLALLITTLLNFFNPHINSFNHVVSAITGVIIGSIENHIIRK